MVCVETKFKSSSSNNIEHKNWKKLESWIAPSKANDKVQSKQGGSPQGVRLRQWEREALPAP